MRNLYASVLLVLTMTAAPGLASACGTDPTLPPPPPTQDGTIQDPLVISMMVAAATNATFLGLDVAYAVDGHTIPHALSVLQAIVGVANFAGAVFAASAGLVNSWRCNSGNRSAVLWSMSIPLMAVGGWLLSHALWSLRVPEEPRLEPSIAIGENHAMLGLTGTF